MKKILVAFASAALVFSMVSCASTKAEDDLGMPSELAALQDEEEAKPEFESAGRALASNDGNNLAAVAPVTIVFDKDISKNPAVDVQGADVVPGVYLGEECVQITPNYNPEIRVAFVFDTPVSAADVKGIKFSVAGFDGGAGAYNCGVMYEDMSGAEHRASFYLSDIAADAWTDVTANLLTDEQWGNNYSADKKIIAVQFWSGDKGPLYLKGLEFTK